MPARPLVRTLLATAVIGAAAIAADAPDAAMPCSEACAAAAANAEFARIKELAGTWLLDDPEHRQPGPVRIEYAITSGGNVVSERDFAGTDHEMLTTFFVRAGKLHLIHYCHLGNRPEFELVKSDATSLTLDLVPGSLADPAEQHMHALVVTRPDADHLRTSWSFFEKGEKTGECDFAFTRLAPAAATPAER